MVGAPLPLRGGVPARFALPVGRQPLRTGGDKRARCGQAVLCNTRKARRNSGLTLQGMQCIAVRTTRQHGCSAVGAAGAAYTGDTADLPTIGVLGGGQLGKMLATAAAQLGLPIRVLDPTPGCPASTVAAQTEGSFRDAAAIAAFADSVDVLTVEIEHVDTEVLQKLEASGRHVYPSAGTLRIIQDKLRQKEFFRDAGVTVSEFRVIGNAADLAAAGSDFGYPFMLKSRMLAYDGRGNAVVRDESGATAPVESLGGYQQGLYAEKWVPYVKELAVMVARGRSGSVAPFPTVETVHRDSICWVTETPARGVPGKLAAAAQRLAVDAVKSLGGVGMFGVELFVTEDGQLLLNEVAPRPHNSGHYTMEGCATSQYEQHLRAILGWPLGSTHLKVGSAVMLNLLGEEAGPPATQAKLGRAFQTAGAAVHWYGKAGITPGRKLGHVTITADSPANARSALRGIDAAAADALERTSEGSAAAGAAAAMEATPNGSGSAPDQQPQVGIIMGSDSDLPTMKAAAQVLQDDFGIPVEVTIVSAHRTPDRLLEYARTAAGRGLKVIIAGAGGAAHLPGMVAAATALPVVGVPCVPAGARLDGLDALLSIVQMPRGVPVATVAIGNAANAGLLAARILAAADPQLLDAMQDYQARMKDTVLTKAARLEAAGWQDY